MAKSMVLHFFGGALADFPEPEDASHFTQGPADDGRWYRRSFGGAAIPLEGLPTDYVRSASVQLVAGTIHVTLAPAIAGAAYRIGLSWDADENVRWANKADNGFDIISGNSLSTANVDWIVTRTAA